MSSRTSGQATVELVALLPLIVLLAAAVWQAALFGHAVWRSSAAARAASRAAALGGDPARVVPRNARVSVTADGAVTVAMPVQAVAGGRRLATVRSSARFEPQR